MTRSDGLVSEANARLYDALGDGEYVGGAPHLRHPSLRRLYRSLAERALALAREAGEPVTALDLGAGEGSATLPLLELGARVTAMDVSRGQLDGLLRRVGDDRAALETRVGDVSALLDEASRREERWGLGVANSFLHHVPDYLDLVRRVTGVLRPGGVFLSFQDPLRYATLPAGTRAFAGAGYLAWRLGRGDLLGGAARRLRRTVGVYRDDGPEDRAEYHVIRGGVDQDALVDLLGSAGYEVEVVRYFSSQGAAWQRLGERLRLENTFALLARRPA
jgi:SAM-dependent methyltransferase